MRALIADDERPARERLRRLLEETGRVEVIGEAADGSAALDAIRELKPDVAFLDIEMPELSGLEAAAVLGLRGPPVVFVTAHDDFALRAFETHALDYLLKPVSRERLAMTLEKLKTRLSAVPDHQVAGSEPRFPTVDQVSGSQGDLNHVLRSFAAAGRLKRLAFRSGTNTLIFDPARISAIIARSRQAEVVSGDELRLVDESLDSLEARLDPHSFLRIHRSSIINLNYLRELRRDGDRKFIALLEDHFGTELPVSRENLEKLRKKLL